MHDCMYSAIPNIRQAFYCYYFFQLESTKGLIGFQDYPPYSPLNGHYEPRLKSLDRNLMLPKDNVSYLRIM